MSLKGEPMWKFTAHYETCESCDMAFEGMMKIVSPRWLDDKYICPDCDRAGLRVCEDCGCFTDDGDIADVSVCPDCRSIESLDDVEAGEVVVPCR